MFQNELQSRIEDLKQQIAAFPPGSITKKKINGKDYFYRLCLNKRSILSSFNNKLFATRIASPSFIMNIITYK